MKNYVDLWQYLAQFFLEWEIFRIKFVQKIKPFYVQYFFSENRVVNEIMWKNMVQPDRYNAA